jgi:hypothetical protein
MMSPSLNSVSLSLRATFPFTGNLKHFRQIVIGLVPTSVFTTARLKVASRFATEASSRPTVLRQNPVAMLTEIILSQTLAVIVAGLVVAAVLH